MALSHNYFVYIMANKHKNVLYIGVTNDLERRVYEHEMGETKGFTKKYNCHFLIYYEHFMSIEHAIDREKQLKRWSRKKKDILISMKNPNLEFLNGKIHLI